jgi:hypothetical protein
LNKQVNNGKEGGKKSEENDEQANAIIRMKKREMISAYEVDKKIKSLEKVHQYEMNNVKTLARHHAIEFLK